MSKKYYVTEGLKFGSEFLLYEGDPSLYHSKYMMKVLSDDNKAEIDVYELIVNERLANTNGKDLIIAYLNPANEINYCIINYSK